MLAVNDGVGATDACRGKRPPSSRPVCRREDVMSESLPQVGELVAITRDVPEASVRRGESGMVLAVEGGLVRVCLDGDAQEVKVPRDAVLRLTPALAAAEAQPRPAPAKKGGWFQFNWSSLTTTVVLMTAMVVVPTCQLLKDQERMFAPPPRPKQKQKVQQVPIRPKERPGQIQRPPPPPQQKSPETP